VVAPSVDLLGLLRPSQVVVTVGGHPFTLEATCASHWLGALATDWDTLYGIVPGLISDDDLEVMQELIAPHPDIEDRWTYAARTALGRAGGRDWWWTLNLGKRSLDAWMYVNGILIRQGVDAKKIGLPDWLDACYTMLWQNCDEEHQMKLDMELSLRPKGVVVHQSKAAVRRMLADFAAD
jgi:hypothetical protein